MTKNLVTDFFTVDLDTTSGDGLFAKVLVPVVILEVKTFERGLRPVNFIIESNVIAKNCVALARVNVRGHCSGFRLKG